MKNLTSYKTTKTKLIMKSLFLTAIASFVCAVAYAQTPVKWTSDNSIHTLNCTEDAVTLKLSVNAGWHINSFHFGNAAPVSTLFETLPLNQYSTKGPVIDSTPYIKFKTGANMGAYPYSDTTFKPTITWRAPKAANVLDKLSYIHWANKIPANTNTDFIIATESKQLNF